MTNIPGGTGSEPAVEDDGIEAAVESAWNEEEYKESGVASPPPDPQGPSRDEYGRFTSAQADAPARQAPAGQTPPSEPAGAAFVQAPGGWNPAAKAEFARLARENPNHPIVQAVAQREQEINQGFAKLQEYRGLDPYAEAARAHGTDLATVMQNYVQAEGFLENNFPDAIGWLCQRYGWSPEQLWGVYTGQIQGRPQPDPLMQHLTQLNQQVNSLRQQQESQRDQVINSQIAEWRDEPGNEKIWVNDVEPGMAYLLENGFASNLQEAYDMACWAHPQIRQELINHFYGPQANGQSNGQSSRQPASNRGRSLNPGSPIPGASSDRGPKRTVLEEVAANYDELAGL